MIFVFQIEVTGQHVGQAAHFAPAHSVGLACGGKRAAARRANAASGQVAIQDCVDLIGARRGLVHALGIDSDDAVRAEPHVAEGFDVGLR